MTLFTCHIKSKILLSPCRSLYIYERMSEKYLSSLEEKRSTHMRVYIYKSLSLTFFFPDVVTRKVVKASLKASFLVD